MKLFLKFRLVFCIQVFLVVSLFSCGTTAVKEEDTTHTKGVLKVMADDTFRPILGTSIETFEAIYPSTKVTISYATQEKSIDALLKGEVDFILSGRKLNKNEEAQVRNRGLFLKVNQLASDALVFIVSKENKKIDITEAELVDIVNGKHKKSLIIDKSSSSNLVYLKDKLKLPLNLTNVTAAGSDSAVIEYVSSHPEAIGIIGMALVSDQEDSKVKSRLGKIDIMTVSYKDSLGNTIKAEVSLDAIATKRYPFIRDIFIINLDGSMNLGTGFANFLVGEMGQRIILKAGLLPYQLPNREIIISK